MGANEIHQGDIGTVFLGTVMDGETVVDVSAATTKALLFRKPSGKTLTKAASFPPAGDGTDGEIQYTTGAGDLDESGTWEWQGRIQFVTGSQWSTDRQEFEVHPNIV